MAKSLFMGLTGLPTGRNLKNPAIHILVYSFPPDNSMKIESWLQGEKYLKQILFYSP